MSELFSVTPFLTMSDLPAQQSGKAHSPGTTRPLSRVVLQPVRLLMIDSCITFQEGLAYAIARKDPSINIVAHASSAHSALSEGIVRDVNVAIIEVDLPERSGFDLGRVLLAQYPRLNILFISYHDWDVYLLAAWKTQAAGLVLRSDSPDVLIDAIHHVALGAVLTQQQLARIVAWEADLGSKLRSLRPREWDVLWQLLNGHGNRAIGQSLNVSENTVERHVTNILQKMGFNSRAMLLSYLYNQHLHVLDNLSQDTRTFILNGD